jgi:hypothetical protein
VESRVLGCAYGEEKAAASVFLSPRVIMTGRVTPMWDHMQNHVTDLSKNLPMSYKSLSILGLGLTQYFLL